MNVSKEITSKLLELIQLDFSGPLSPSLSGNCYALAVLDSNTAKSDVSWSTITFARNNYTVKGTVCYA